MKAELSYNIKLLDDDDNTKLFDPEGAFVIGKDDLLEFGKIEFNLAGESSDIKQDFTQVNDVKILLITTTEDIKIKFNSDKGEEIPIIAGKISGSTKYGILMITTENVDAIYFTNEGTAEAKIKCVYIA